MKTRNLFPILLCLVLIFAGCAHSTEGIATVQEQPKKVEEKIVPEGECTSNADCPEGYSCWHRLPGGPLPGIPGSPENPGRCYNDDMVGAIR